MEMQGMLKKGLIVGGVGFALSFFINIINFSGVGRLFTKGVVGFVVWFVFFMVVVYVLKQFVPELYAVIFDESSDSPSTKGNSLDITLGDDESENSYNADPYEEGQEQYGSESPLVDEGNGDSDSRVSVNSDFSNLEERFKETLDASGNDMPPPSNFKGGAPSAPKSSSRSSDPLLADFDKIDPKTLAKGVKSVMNK